MSKANEQVTAEEVIEEVTTVLSKTVVELEQPIIQGETKITQLTLRKPTAGELRGIKLIQIMELIPDAFFQLIPRICTPTVTIGQLHTIDATDLLEIMAKIASMLEKKSSQPQ